MSRRFHFFYWLAIFVWIALRVQFPAWEGRSYNPDRYDNPRYWTPSGTFGLKGLGDGVVHAPIWMPPRPRGSTIEATVRWPWQSPSRPYHVEISMTFFVLWVVGGLILLGIAGRIATVVRPPPAPDPLLVVTWSLSLGLIIGCVLGFVLMIFTMGFAPGLYYLAPVVLGGTGGLVSGYVSVARSGRRSRSVVSPAGGEDIGEGASLDENSDAPRVDLSLGESPSMGMGILWFTVGFVGSLALLFAGIEIANHFRGPVRGISTLFTPEYERNQAPVNMTTGAAIAGVGWITGLWLFCARRNYALGAGLITGATLFGIVIASWR